MKFETLDVQGFDAAITSMRNPYKSYDKADSNIVNEDFALGSQDYDLASRL